MKIDIDEIRKLFAPHIYERGEGYYRDGRVHLVEIEPKYFKAMVAGTHDYLVEVNEEEDGWLFTDCTCPYDAHCKHVVAALLAAQDYYHEHAAKRVEADAHNWQSYLTQIEETKTAYPPKPAKWQMVFSLRLGLLDWTIYTQKISRKKDGTFGPPRDLSLYDLSDISVARHSNQSAAFSFLEKWQEYRSYTHNYDSGRFKFKYGDKIGYVFTLLRDGGLYFGDDENLGTPLEFVPGRGRVEFRLTDVGERTHFYPYLKLADEELQIDANFRVLCSDPLWLLTGNRLIEIEGMNHAASLIPFTRQNYDVSIPKEDVPKFLSAISSQIDLFEHVRLPEQVKTKTIADLTDKRLYVSEFEDGILVKLRMCYAGIEVDINDARQTLWGVDDSDNSFVKVLRNREQETEALQSLLNTSVKLAHDGRITTRKSKVLVWLLEEMPHLLASGFTIFGEEKLKHFKVNRATAQVRVAVETSIDWFDLNVEIDFGGVLLSIKELKKALKQKNNFVKLADGSTGQLSKPWIERFRHVLNLSEEEGGSVKLSHFHATMIDELFAEAAEKEFDATYNERLQQLRDFAGIQKRPAPKALRGTLRPYQQAGLEWLHFLREYQFGGCLADDMGLGKTIQTLSLLLSIKDEGESEPNLIVAPTSVVFNWVNEMSRFAPGLRVFNQTGIDRDRTTKNYSDYDVVLTSYGTLRRDFLFLKDVQFNYVILDESQYIKNPVSQTAKVVKLLKAKHRLALTGTPIENNTIELWSLFSFLNPGLLGNLTYFKDAFARPIEQSRDQDAADLLRKTVFPFLLRRTKDQVEKDLPPKVESVVYCEMLPQQEKLYNQWRDFFRAALLKQIADVGLVKSRMNVLEGLVKLRQIACHPLLVEDDFNQSAGKYDALIENVEEILAEGHKILIFSQFVRMLTIIRGHFDTANIPYEYLDGRTRNRKSCVERFQSDAACRIFLISLRAGGTGLNLTAADYVIHYDPWWNPAVEAQATDRSHRIGQDKHVFVYKMITRATVEEKILQLQERKKQLLSDVITTEAGLFKRLSVDDIKELFS
jgi:non-specific serine/threonine protein kinase